MSLDKMKNMKPIQIRCRTNLLRNTNQFLFY